MDIPKNEPRKFESNSLVFSLFSDMSFQCLASWPGDSPGESYLSLLDTKLPQLGEEPRPRYRCAVSSTFPPPFFVTKSKTGKNVKFPFILQHANVFTFPMVVF